MREVILIGAGGHARGIVEILEASGWRVSAYVDPLISSWLDRPRIEESEVPDGASVAIGIGGVTPEQLDRRLATGESRWVLVSVIHRSAIVSATAVVEPGAHVLAGAILEANVRVGRMAIVNSGATIIHDSSIGEGAHVAPGVTVLAGARIGRAAMIGAGAVVLPFTTVPDLSLAPALKIWRDPVSARV